MHITSHPEAEQELEAAALWYEERQGGLGKDFLDEFEDTIRRIEADPAHRGRSRAESCFSRKQSQTQLS
jgi:plasmid stabilization system protein ParE